MGVGPGRGVGPERGVGRGEARALFLVAVLASIIAVAHSGRERSKYR